MVPDDIEPSHGLLGDDGAGLPAAFHDDEVAEWKRNLDVALARRSRRTRWAVVIALLAVFTVAALMLLLGTFL